MINIITNGKSKFKTTCERCLCVFEYDLSDLFKMISCEYVRCPHCKNDVLHYPSKEDKENPTTVANPDKPKTSCENCAKKSSCKLQNKVNFSELMPKMIVCDKFTPTETDFKYFTAKQVRNMSQKEVKENYSDIMKSMKKW